MEGIIAYMPKSRTQGDLLMRLKTKEAWVIINAIKHRVVLIVQKIPSLVVRWIWLRKRKKEMESELKEETGLKTREGDLRVSSH